LGLFFFVFYVLGRRIMISGKFSVFLVVCLFFFYSCSLLFLPLLLLVVGFVGLGRLCGDKSSVVVVSVFVF